MIAEFANYRSWIAWVPIVAPLLAIALVYRRVPALSLGIVGGLLGLAIGAVVAVFDPTIENWVTFELLSLLIGIGLGVVVGAVIAHRSRRRSPPVRDGSLLPVGLAMTLGILGILIGSFTPAVLHGASPDMDIDVIVAATIGGGFGWILGATIGWLSTRGAPPPGGTQRWALCVMALTIALFGSVVGLSIRAAQFGPPIDDVGTDDPRLPPTATLVYADTALAVVTLMVVAARGLGREQAS